MKRLFFASCVLGLVAASGCGDDDSNAAKGASGDEVVVLADADTQERSDGGAQPVGNDGGHVGADDAGQPGSPDHDASAAMMDAMTQVEPDSGAADAGSAIDAGHAPAVPVPFRVIVLDSPTATRQPNIDVFAFDENGEDFDPASHGVTDANGEVTLQVPSTGRFALEALGVPNQLVETYDYGVSVAASPDGHSLYLASVLADMRDSEDGDFSANPEAAPVSGGVSWLGSGETISTAIGCVTITDDGVMDFRAISQENGRPLPPTERDPALGTVRSNGGFILGNVSAGQHTLSAKLPDGTLLDTVKIAIVPRADAATSYGNRYHVQFEINGAPGEDNPTPADCPYP